MLSYGGPDGEEGSFFAKLDGWAALDVSTDTISIDSRNDGVDS